MQAKFGSHNLVQIITGQETIKVKVKDFGGNESTKDLRQFNGISGKIRNQVVGPSIKWQITQWYYDLEIDDGSRIYKIPEGNLKDAG